MTLAAVILGLLPALLLLTLAIVTRVQAPQKAASTGPQFAPLPGATVLFDALLLDVDRRLGAAVLIDLAVRRQIRLLADPEAPGRAPIGIEMVAGARFSAEELSILEALFGPDHRPGRVRRFSADGRALHRRLRAVLSGAQARLVDAGLIRPGRRYWPVVLLRVFSWIVILVSFLLFSVALGMNDGAGDGLAVAIGFVACLTAVAALVVTPHPWRTFLPASQPLRSHLAGIREYIALAEAEPLRVLQSVHGAELRGDVSPAARAAALQRYLLNERLLPYAVLFGLESSWLAALKAVSDDPSAAAGLGEVIEVAASIADVLALVGGIAQLVGAVGDLTDAAGGVVEVVGGVLEAVSS